jgi:hypothetical protein
MRTGFQTDVNRRTLHIHASRSRSAQSHDFSVCAASGLGVAVKIDTQCSK